MVGLTSTRQPRTERWIVARHVDRLLGMIVQPAYSPDIPRDQYVAALALAVRGLAGIAGPHATPIERDGWAEALAAGEDEEPLMEAFNSIYSVLWSSGVLRPSPLEHEDL